MRARRSCERGRLYFERKGRRANRGYIYTTGRGACTQVWGQPSCPVDQGTTTKPWHGHNPTIGTKARQSDSIDPVATATSRRTLVSAHCLPSSSFAFCSIPRRFPVFRRCTELSRISLCRHPILQSRAHDAATPRCSRIISDIILQTTTKRCEDAVSIDGFVGTPLVINHASRLDYTIAPLYYAARRCSVELPRTCRRPETARRPDRRSMRPHAPPANTRLDDGIDAGSEHPVLLSSLSTVMVQVSTDALDLLSIALGPGREAGCRTFNSDPRCGSLKPGR